MTLMPDPDTARMDPFTDEPTLLLTCDVIEPSDGKGYDRDPRSIAKRGEAYLKSTGSADTGSASPSPAIRREETSCTNSGAPAGTGGRMGMRLVTSAGTGTSFSRSTARSTAAKFFSTTTSPRLP